jgi:hypothetical protein
MFVLSKALVIILKKAYREPRKNYQRYDIHLL